MYKNTITKWEAFGYFNELLYKNHSNNIISPKNEIFFQTFEV